MLKDYYGKDASALLEKKLYLLDMDGTIYLGNRLFPKVKELLEKMESRGGRYVFITNNASNVTFDFAHYRSERVLFGRYFSLTIPPFRDKMKTE